MRMEPSNVRRKKIREVPNVTKELSNMILELHNIRIELSNVKKKRKEKETTKYAGAALRVVQGVQMNPLT